MAGPSAGASNRSPVRCTGKRRSLYPALHKLEQQGRITAREPTEKQQAGEVYSPRGWA